MQLALAGYTDFFQSSDHPGDDNGSTYEISGGLPRRSRYVVLGRAPVVPGLNLSERRPPRRQYTNFALSQDLG